jgi:hypothetical protein
MEGRRPGAEVEQIRLPGRSLIPLVTGAGVTVMLVGLILSWWIVAVGAAIVIGSALRWIARVREEIESLPRERR